MQTAMGKMHLSSRRLKCTQGGPGEEGEGEAGGSRDAITVGGESRRYVSPQ